MVEMDCASVSNGPSACRCNPYEDGDAEPETEEVCKLRLPLHHENARRWRGDFEARLMTSLWAKAS